MIFATLLPQIGPIWVPLLVTVTILVMSCLWDMTEGATTAFWHVVWHWIFGIWLLYLLWASLTLYTSIAELTP